MIRRLTLSLALAAGCGTAAPAQDIAGPEAIFSGDVMACNGSLGDGLDPWLACLGENGASEQAMAFSRALARSPDFGFEGVMTGFRELGAIDIAEVFLPVLANTNVQLVMVNGPVPIISPGTLYAQTPPDDGGTRALRAVFPAATPSGRIYVGAHRALGEGRQRFVVTDILTDGCRGCEMVGVSITHLEFDNGTFVGATPMGWAGVSGDLPAALSAGDPRALQVALNLAGYDAGGMDGIIGPRTRRALASFLAEFCQPPEAGLTPEAIPLLVSANREGPPPPCAGAAPPATDLRFPFPDGRYVTEARFCVPDPDTYLEHSNEIMVVEGPEIFTGEDTVCTIASLTRQSETFDLMLTCVSLFVAYGLEDADGPPESSPLRLVRQAATRFATAEGDVFQRCDD